MKRYVKIGFCIAGAALALGIVGFAVNVATLGIAGMITAGVFGASSAALTVCHLSDKAEKEYDNIKKANFLKRANENEKNIDFINENVEKKSYDYSQNDTKESNKETIKIK